MNHFNGGLPMRRFAIVVGLGLIAACAVAQGNGKLQLHFIDVGQGMGTLLVSPNGETVLFDDGANKACDKPLSYLQQLGVTKIDYHVISHYHADHLGCASQVLTEFSLQKVAYDRGTSITSDAMSTASYQNYVTVVGAKRRTPTRGETLTLDVTSAHPVTITFVTLNGNGVPTTNENDLSLVSFVHFDEFDAELGGNLSGENSGNYADIETTVIPLVHQFEVYEVHHHGSRYSSNDAWLATIKPRVGIVSTGDGNSYHHPTAECLARLHNAGIKTYWTEDGNGVSPDPDYDTVGGNIIIEAAPGAHQFTVTGTRPGTSMTTYPTWEANSSASTGTPAITYAWSKNSTVYHYSTCRYVQNISPGNLMTDPTPPQGKTLHKECPKIKRVTAMTELAAPVRIPDNENKVPQSGTALCPHGGGTAQCSFT
jgi:beta-lactamase superfamily II metal-dependent hydrolase